MSNKVLWLIAVIALCFVVGIVLRQAHKYVQCKELGGVLMKSYEKNWTCYNKSSLQVINTNAKE